MAGPYPRPSSGEPARTATGRPVSEGTVGTAGAQGTKVDARGGPTLPLRPPRRSDVRAFECPVCRQLVFFENNQCLRCRALLGFEPRAREIVALDRGPQTWVRCANFDDRRLQLAPRRGRPRPAVRLLPAHPHPARRRRRRGSGGIPGDRGSQAPARLPAPRAGSPRRPAERLPGLGHGLRPALQPTPARRRPAMPTAWSRSTSRSPTMPTGSRSAVTSASPTGRCSATFATRSPTTTGRSWWQRRRRPSTALASCSATSGSHYREALDAHYAQGPPAGWPDGYVSAYATVHPWEDWAETFAHYLHIRDTLQTAAAFGITVSAPHVLASAEQVAPCPLGRRGRRRRHRGRSSRPGYRSPTR